MIFRLVQRARQWLPTPLLNGLRALGLPRLVRRFYRDAEVELRYQQQFAAELRRIPGWQETLTAYWQTQRRLETLLQAALFEPGQRVLDVGCGLTSVLRCLPEPPSRQPGLRVGVDPLASHYRSLVPWPESVVLVRAPAASLPFPDGSFDLVCCSNALDHMPDPAQALREMHRVLTPNGQLLLTVELFGEPDAAGVETSSGIPTGAASLPPNRGPAHPHSLTRIEAERLLSVNFEPSYQAVVPWLGLRQYMVDGVRTGQARELLWVGKKRLPTPASLQHPP